MAFILQQKLKDGTWTLVQAGLLDLRQHRYRARMLAVTLKYKIFLSILQHFTVFLLIPYILIAWMRLRILDYNDLEPSLWPTISLLSGARAARTVPQMPPHISPTTNSRS